VGRREGSREQSDRSPVAIGGVGGSGTRLIVSIQAALGFHIGSDLNESLDNLWFTLLFKWPKALDCPDQEFGALFTIFRKAMRGSDPLTAEEIRLVGESAAGSRPQHDSAWLAERAESLIRESAGPPRNSSAWGWKEPNTHVVLERLNEIMPDLRYIHVARNGLDMAYSANQNQLETWGARLFGAATLTVTPRLSLRYWVAVHRRMIELGQRMGSRFLMVNYDRLCADPELELPALLKFFGTEPSRERLAIATALVNPSASLGRFKCRPLDEFDPDDVAFVEKIGFDVR
jgi:hypothetical protein